MKAQPDALVPGTQRVWGQHIASIWRQLTIVRLASFRPVPSLRSAEHPISSVGDDLEQLNALLSGDDPGQGFYGGFASSPHRPAGRPGGGSSASGSVTDDLEQLNALLTADDPPVSDVTPTRLS